MKVYCIENRQAPFIEVFKRTGVSNGYDVQLIAPADKPPQKFIEFTQHYIHRSVNSPAFELACFRRYFEIEDIAPSTGRFLIADSDIYFNARAEAFLNQISHLDFDLMGSVGSDAGELEEDISPHFSMWTKHLLSDFIVFLIDVYRTRPKTIEALYEDRCEKASGYGAISDMTLLYLFKKSTTLRFFNSNVVFNGLTIDHNLACTEAVGDEFSTSWGYKNIEIDLSNTLFFRSLNAGQVRPLVVHLQGQAKRIALMLELGNINQARLALFGLNLAKNTRKFFRALK